MPVETRTAANGQEMKTYTITCPYCFKTFSDNQVHFRFRALAENLQMKSTSRIRSYDDEEEEEEDDDEEVSGRKSEGDALYLDFWKTFGGQTSEVAEHGLAPWNIPVYDPKADAKMFAAGNNKFIRINGDGMVIGARYKDGKTTSTERVCPYCHNPLMGSSYGLYPIKLISVIGVTAAGKTAFLSQLCKIMKESMAQYGLTAQPTSRYAEDYVVANEVAMGKRLPDSTPAERLLQPICFDITYTVKNALGAKEKCVNTIVFYDIAGENCIDAVGMSKFGKFIEESDGIILLIPPKQFGIGRSEEDNLSFRVQPTAVLDCIYNTFYHTKRIQDVPLAICISQGDLIAEQILHGNKLTDISYLDKNGKAIRKFNATDYNPIHESIMSFLDREQVALCQQLEDQYDNYNYFIVSALGTNVDEKTHTPDGPTIPLRIMEPFTWLLTKFDFLDADDFVYQPEDWHCPICGKRQHNSPDSLYCSIHKVNEDGMWKCDYCSTDPSAPVLYSNKVKWCKKCKRDRFGKKRTIIDLIKDLFSRD